MGSTRGVKVDAQVRAVAEELGLAIVRPFTSGMFGAVLVVTTEGEEHVLKSGAGPGAGAGLGHGGYAA